MILSRIVLKNWRNFRRVDVELGDRVFLVGPNASGKSNFLDAVRFMRDIVKPGGGLQSAILARGGLSKIRCLAARQDPEVEMEFYLAQGSGQPWFWRYVIGIKQESKGQHLHFITREEVWQSCKEQPILLRPDKDDQKDKIRLTQTHLEQINANQRFRDLETFFKDVQYLHLVPQFIRFPISYGGSVLPDDPFGQDFLKRLSQATDKQRTSRLKKIEEALKIAVPQFTELTYMRDDMGKPHMEARYAHWRPQGAKHREDQFSDGTVRLIGLLWSLLDTDSLLLLEEPELSLHSAIVQKIPAIIDRLNRKRKRQIFLSTHSAELLSDKGIGGEEILMLIPSREGTEIKIASTLPDVVALLENGFSAAEAVLPKTVAPGLAQSLWPEE